MRVITLLFLLMCMFLWLPAERYAAVNETALSSPRPAGEITSAFRLLQTVFIPHLADKLLTKNKEWCFGARFATFRRDNDGQIAVTWEQGVISKRWVVESSELADNELRYFCPGRHLRLDLPFIVAIEGVRGVPGSSPTVWLTSDVRYGQVSINGKPQAQSLDIGVARKVHMTPATLIRLDHGAFLVGWLCTLLTGLAALLWMPRANSARARAFEGN